MIQGNLVFPIDNVFRANTKHVNGTDHFPVPPLKNAEEYKNASGN